MLGLIRGRISVMHRSFKNLTTRVRPALVAAAAFSFLAALPVVTSQAQAATSQVGESDLPRMVVSVDSLEYGEIFDNKIIDKTFTIANEGASTLVIRGVKGSCQCTEPKIGDTVLDPGESTDVTVGIKPFNKTGNFRQRITITSNDPMNPNEVLEVNGLKLKGKSVHDICDTLCQMTGTAQQDLFKDKSLILLLLHRNADLRHSARQRARRGQGEHERRGQQRAGHAQPPPARVGRRPGPPAARAGPGGSGEQI